MKTLQVILAAKLFCIERHLKYDYSKREKVTVVNNNEILFILQIRSRSINILNSN